MNLKSIKLKPSYISLEDDVAELFYIPVMSNSIRFDRISCYFTYDAIAKYCKGIYYLGKNKGKFRLLISENISEETFEIIKEGYVGYNLLDDAIKEHMRDTLNLEDCVTLSNLAYLIKCGLVEIKFAYCHSGLFHEKSGYAEDDMGNNLCFTGSNNETKESIINNYEKFEVTTSWLSSGFDCGKITKTKNEFESMWNGTNPHVVVFDPPESFDTYLQSFNKGALFENASTIIKGSYYLDYCESRIRLSVPEKIENLAAHKFVMAIQSLVDSIDKQVFIMKPDLTNQDVIRLLDKIKKQSDKDEIETFKSSEFIKYIESHTSLEKTALLGLSIKQREPVHKEYFDLFKKQISKLTVNNLRDEQIWDAYFAFRLKKSANFSVPGSGKTATALGMFAYLNQTADVKRLIVLGPLNCFDSWIFEFSRVFGDNLPLKSITSSEMREMGNKMQYHIRLNLGRYNLVLLNYESFDHNDDLTNALQQHIDDKTMLVFDEVHRIKSVGGKRATGVIPISKNSKYTMVMTGTPIPNNYSDVYNFLHILFENDYDDYFRLTPSDLSDLCGSDAVEFNKKLQPFFCRTTKNKLNVPPAEPDNIVRIKASSEENKLFVELRKMKMNPLSVMIRILQLESNPSMLKDNCLNEQELSSFIEDTELNPNNNLETLDIATELITSKTKKCIELIKTLTDSGKTVIVWCIFVKSIENITNQLRKIGISTCNIFGASDDRQTTLNDFKNGKYKVLITNPQTLAESVSLHHTCHDAIYFEYSFNLVHMLQSKDRIHRLGLNQNQYTQYHFLETVFDVNDQMISLDEEIHDRLNHKENVMLEAIENDSLEHFSTTKKEIEDLLRHLGFDEELLK